MFILYELNEAIAISYDGRTARHPNELSRPGTSVSFTSAQDALLSREQSSELSRQKYLEMINEARVARSSAGCGRVFHCSESPSFVAPMFKSIWRAVLAFSTECYPLIKR
jgi:hypothetical protein